MTACGMSFISMLAMETAMNLTDYVLTGGGDIDLVGSPHCTVYRFYNTLAL